ncbi:hypothetical protein [Salinimicrobium oceani]|uniref:hypothetical protein n=1 Tax=Salinimicrobium oceani TaxID=2722702 RepID=UPI001ADD7BD7|nr:hypothetical protein [Salinimicrobium oceani]
MVFQLEFGAFNLEFPFRFLAKAAKLNRKARESFVISTEPFLLRKRRGDEKSHDL